MCNAFHCNGILSRTQLTAAVSFHIWGFTLPPPTSHREAITWWIVWHTTHHWRRQTTLFDMPQCSGGYTSLEMSMTPTMSGLVLTVQWKCWWISQNGGRRLPPIQYIAMHWPQHNHHSWLYSISAASRSIILCWQFVRQSVTRGLQQR